MLISRFALALFSLPGVCPLRSEYFHIPQKDYGFLFLFSLFNFQGPVRSVSSVKRLTILSHLSMFVKNFFPEVFLESFSILSHRFRFVKNFFLSAFRGTFLSYHNQSRFVKIFFRSRRALDYSTTLSPSCQRLFSLFFAFSLGLEYMSVFFTIYPHLFIPKGQLLYLSILHSYLPLFWFFAILRTF